MDLGAAPLGAGVSLWFTSHDVAALHDHAEASGANVLQAPQDGPFGRMIVVADPDGYALTFHEPPQEG
jgi:predicted enzyme related to lactoylglutathione lyase